MAIKLLKLKNSISSKEMHYHSSLKQILWKRTFKNPVGMAAGFDKNAEVFPQLFNLGFGSVEVGTVVPLPQPGNPKPRCFRIPEVEGMINRFGFNSLGSLVVKENIRRSYEFMLDVNYHNQGVLGINIGKNKTSTSLEDSIKDYVHGLKRFYTSASYLVVNISSPNTPGLRDLQHKAELETLLKALMSEIKELRCAEHDRFVPLLVKLSPDMSLETERDAVETCLVNGVDGLIISNTTLDRPQELPDNLAKEVGGLSGKLLFNKSTAMLGRIYGYTKGKIPLIGVGGISSPQDAYIKIRMGASLVQLYTALVYKGPSLVTDINDFLVEQLASDGFHNVSEAVGSLIDGTLDS